ncbi:UNVERIFIED_CONTAM: hypothetical protein NCL1_13252 [Trichonephila clavipes]
MSQILKGSENISCYVIPLTGFKHKIDYFRIKAEDEESLVNLRKTGNVILSSHVGMRSYCKLHAFPEQFMRMRSITNLATRTITNN